jgi:hypothetical protein
LPSHRLDRASTSPGAEPISRQPSRSGVFPFPERDATERREEGGAGEVQVEQVEVLRHVATGAPLPGAGRVAARGGERSRREKTPKQSREPGAATYAYTAPPSTSGRQRLHRRSVVSTVVFSFLASYLLLALPVCVPSCRRTPVASSFFHERAATRVALGALPRRGHPRYAASAVMVNAPSRLV